MALIGATSLHANTTAVFSHRQGFNINSTLTDSLKRLSSGRRIHSAGDDAMGMAVAEKHRTQVQGLRAASRNIQDGRSFLEVAQAGITEVHNILQRMRELMIQAANDTYTDTDRSLIQLEVQQLLNEINRIHSSAEYNDQQVFDYRAADIVWIVDGTGSMGPEQATLAAEAPNFVNELSALNIDFRLGVVGYGYNGMANEPPLAFGSMTTDPTTFGTNVTNVGTGGAPEENAMEALNFTRTAFSYRPTARKIFIVVTDEDADDGVQPPVNDVASTDITATTRQNMINDKVIVFVAASAGTGAVTEEAYSAVPGSQGIPAATGGQQFTAINSTMSSTLANAVNSVIGEAKQFHIGAGKDQTFVSEFVHPIDSSSLGISARVSASTRLAAESSITWIDSAINQVSRLSAKLGSEVNRLEHALNYTGTVRESMTSALARTEDTDFANEMVTYTNAQIIAQSTSSIQAQANLLSQNILALLT